MRPPSTPTPAWRAVAAAGALLAAIHGAHAATPAQDPSHGQVAGELSLRQACPAVAVADLADALAPAWDDADKPSAVAVTFKVRRRHVFDVAPATDSARTFQQIRRAVYGLSCDSGDDQPHVVRLIIRFIDPAATSRPATNVDASGC